MRLRLALERLASLPKRPHISSATHNLAAYDEVDCGFGWVWMSGAVGSQELVRVEVTPSARILVDNLDLGLLSNVLADVLCRPVECLVILTGR